jgi:dipeptidase
MRRGFLWFSFITILVFLSLPMPAIACTLWAVAGDRVAGGGTIIHKNRDWNPDHQQDLRLVIPKNGFRYLSLYTTGNEWVGTKAGVNSQGLVIVTASAPAYLDKKVNFEGKTNTATLLSRYDSVDMALKALESGKWKCGPEFIIMADKTEIASIEFGPDGQYAVISRKSNGVAFHTNHYRSDELTGLNPEKINASSVKRYAKINDLLESNYTLDVETAHSFSKDPVLWRTGTTPTSVRTLSAWTIRHYSDGRSTLHLIMANPGKPEMSYEITLADAFSGKYDVTSVR